MVQMWKKWFLLCPLMCHWFIHELCLCVSVPYSDYMFMLKVEVEDAFQTLESAY
jgi:hypothetical protein